VIRYLGNSYIFDKYSLHPFEYQQVGRRRKPTASNESYESDLQQVSHGVGRRLCCPLCRVGCQSERRILSQQSIWTEVTARHTPVIPRRVFCVFQQDGVPAHRVQDTITFLARQTPGFIPPTLWPPNSPDLSPVDYSVWSVLQEKVYRSKIADVDELKTRQIDEWAQFDQSIGDAAVSK